MPELVIQSDHIVLDACCIINFAATGKFDNIIEAVPSQCVVATYVMKHEVLSFINIYGQEAPISVNGLVQKGLMLEVGIDYADEKEANYIVAFEADNLDSGEAESAAIAINRDWAIATDDKRAIKVIAQTSPKTHILTTPELIKHWVDKFDVNDDVVKQAIKSIRKYTPPLTHPLVDWWKKYL